MTQSMKQEKAFLQGMKSGGGSKSYLSGFLKMPRTSRMMYGHALQSYIWNWAVAKRIELYGFEICKLIFLFLSSRRLDSSKKIRRKRRTRTRRRRR